MYDEIMFKGEDRILPVIFVFDGASDKTEGSDLREKGESGVKTAEKFRVFFKALP